MGLYTYTVHILTTTICLGANRFIDCEAWRKETKLDEILPTWDYPEKAEIFKYYPQYYHKTDKVKLQAQDAGPSLVGGLTCSCLLCAF